MVRMFCVAFLLFISAIVCGFCRTGETIVKKSVTPFEIRGVVRNIWDTIVAGGKPQIGFLYLQNNDDGSNINYGNEVFPTGRKLRDILAPNVRTGTPRPPFYPENPENTNLLVALPDTAQANNEGHSEHRLLGQIDRLLEGYNRRYRKCPNAVILGTYYAPCVSRRDRPYGCTDDYIATKNRLIAAEKCVKTKYYLYAHDKPKDPGPLRVWHRIVAMLLAENIHAF